jgi:hypothetical protein
MPTYDEVASGGIYANSSASYNVLYRPTDIVQSAVLLPVFHSSKALKSGLPNRLSHQSNHLLHWWSSNRAGSKYIYDSVGSCTATILGTDPESVWESDATRGGIVYICDGIISATGAHASNVNCISGATELTVFFRIYFPSFPTKNITLFRQTSTPDDNGLTVRWLTAEGISASVCNGGTGTRGFTTTSGFVTGKWYNVAVVFNGNGTGNQGRLKIFVNGVMQTLTFHKSIPASIGNTSGAVSNIFVEGDNNVKLDDLRIYDTHFDSLRIRNLSNAQDPYELDVTNTVVALADIVENDGILAGGSAFSQVIINASGGVKGDGSAPNISFIPMDGGVVIAGQADSFLTVGGLLGSGTAGVNGITNEPPFGQPARGVLVGGLAETRNMKVYSYSDLGEQIIMGGEANAGITAVRYNPTGGIVLESSPIVNFSFTKNITFLWNVRTVIERSITFLWNVGRLKMYWYRVVSKGIDGNEPCPLQGNPCCQKFIVTVHARTIAELCEKLSKRNYKFPIQSVEKFSRPAENSELAAETEAGINPKCQQLIPVEICGVPACADFCVDYDLEDTFGFEAKAQVNAFFEAEGDGSAFTGGAAEASYTRNLMEFLYEGSGGPTTAGEAVASPNSFNGRGGAVMGGSAFAQSSGWFYVGGVWPNTRGVIYGTSSESVRREEADQIWSLPDRVQNNDILFAQTDISFGKKSDLLVTKEFGLSLPNWASILGVYVRISRLATQVGVRDLEVYLVKSGEIISDNLANTISDWPLIETQRLYGSSGLDGGTPWRNPDDDHYAGPLTVSDLNDPTFGVAIRVRSRTPLATQRAKINYINVEVYYEDANGSIIRTGGEATAKSPSYHYSFRGKTVVDSLVAPKLGYKFKSKGLGSDGFGAIQIDGHGSLGFYEGGTGGLIAGGEAKITPFFDTMEGGATGGGEAKITPFFDTMDGGMVAGGKALRSNKIHYAMSGGPVLESMFFTPERKLSYTASGGVIIDSAVRVRSNYWKFVSSGNMALIIGGADQKPGSVTPPFQEIHFDMLILQTQASFTEDIDLQNAQILVGSVNKCGCLSIPLTVELTQNIARNNIFSKFLVRNNYKIPKILRMKYNEPNDSWQCNLHYRGQSAEASTPESWDVLMELQCTDVMGGIGIGRSIWKLAVQFYRKNLVTREAFETRIIVGVIPDQICLSSAAVLDFTVTYDTQLNLAVVSPNATVYQSNIYDNIGLFKNRAWIEDPELILQISQASSTQPVRRVDLTKAVLL